MPPAPSRSMTAPGQLRATRQGDAILRSLDKASGFLSAQELHALMRSEGESVGLTTVYRHLGLMADAGVVDSVTVSDGSVVFRRCKGDGHHHHIVCRSCGASVEVRDEAVEEWASRAAKAAGYSDVTHTVEVFGICRACRRAGKT